MKKLPPGSSPHAGLSLTRRWMRQEGRQGGKMERGEIFNDLKEEGHGGDGKRLLNQVNVCPAKKDRGGRNSQIEEKAPTRFLPPRRALPDPKMDASRGASAKKKVSSLSRVT